MDYILPSPHRQSCDSRLLHQRGFYPTHHPPPAMRGTFSSYIQTFLQHSGTLSVQLLSPTRSLLSPPAQCPVPAGRVQAGQVTMLPSRSLLSRHGKNHNDKHKEKMRINPISFDMASLYR